LLFVEYTGPQQEAVNMPIVGTILLVLAMLLFLVGAVQAQFPNVKPINWTSLGLAILVIAYLLARGAA